MLVAEINLDGKEVKRKTKENKYCIRFVTTVECGDFHEHPMAEVEIEAKSLQDAIDIVKRGCIEVQNVNIEKGEEAFSRLGKNNFRILK